MLFQFSQCWFIIDTLTGDIFLRNLYQYSVFILTETKVMNCTFWQPATGQWYFLYTLCLENLFFGDNNLRFLYMFSWLLKAAAFSSDRPCIALRSFFKSNLLSLRNGKILLYLLLFFFSFFGSVSLLFLKASHCWKILKNKQRPIPRGQSPSFILNFLMLNPFFRETFWYKG